MDAPGSSAGRRASGFHLLVLTAPAQAVVGDGLVG